MCIIMAHEPGKVIADEYLDNSAFNHPHGCGIAFVEHGKVQMYRTLSADKIKKKYKEILKRLPNSPIVLHYRRKTAGSATIDNCHPFRVNKDIVFAHNKTIHPCKPDEKNNPEDKSDTRIFNEQILQNLPEGWFQNPAIDKVLEDFIGNSRIAFLTSDGVIHLLNPQKGEWKDDIWYSNDSFKKKEVKTPPVESVWDKDKRRIKEESASGIGPKDINGNEYVMDNLITRWMVQEQHTFAWDYDLRKWRKYNCQAGRFQDLPYSCDKHRPGAFKPYYDTWVENRNRNNVVVLSAKEDYSDTQFSCDHCRQMVPWSDLTQVIIRGRGNCFLCQECSLFHHDVGDIIQYILD